MRRAPLRVLIVALLPGCGGASSCGGGLLPPIPGGFDERASFPGAVDVRLTEGGLDQLERELPVLAQTYLPAECGRPGDLSCPTGFREIPGGAANPSTCSAAGRCVEQASGAPGPLVGFAIEATTQSGVQVCFDASSGSAPPECAAWLRLEGLTLSPRAPDFLQATLSAQLQTSPIPFRARILGRDVDCVATVDSWSDARPLQDIVADLRFSGYVPPGGGPTGGLRILVEDVRASIPRDDVDIAAPPGAGVGDRLACAGFNAARGVLAGLLTRSLREIVQDEVDAALGRSCAAGCERGQTCTDGLCVDGSGVVVPDEPGLEGRVDIAALVAALGGGGSPPAADLSVRLGAGARADATGLGFGLRGGLELAGSAASCVAPRASPRSLPGFAPTPPLPDDDRVDLDFDGTAETSYMVALGLSRAFADQVAWTIEQSGVLCGAISSDAVPLVNTGAFALLVPSLARLTGADRDPDAVFPARVRLRPGGPMRIMLGEGEVRETSSGMPELVSPLFRLTLDELELELEAVVERRWVRIMSATLDLTLDLGATVGSAGQIELVVGDTANAARDVRVVQSELVAESPMELADAIPALLQLALPELTRQLPSFTIPGPASLGGVDLRVVGIRGVGSPPTHAAVFADVGFGMGTPDIWMASVETRAVVGEPSREGRLSIELPRYAPSGDPLEHQLRWGDGAWSPFFAGGTREVSRAALRVEGRHRLSIRSRRAGLPGSLDPTPLRLEVISDHSGPRVAARVDHGRRGLIVRARDVVDGAAVALFLKSEAGVRSIQPDLSGFASAPELSRPGPLTLIALDLSGNETRLRLRDGGPRAAPPARDSPPSGCQDAGAQPGFLGLLLLLPVIWLRRGSHAA